MRWCALSDVRGSIAGRYPGVEVSDGWDQWNEMASSVKTREAGLGFVLLFPLFVIILVKYVFDSREQRPPLLRNQGARGGSRG